MVSGRSSVFHVRYHVRRRGFFGLHSLPGHTWALLSSLLGGCKRICDGRQFSLHSSYAPYFARNYHSYAVERVSVVLICPVFRSNWCVTFFKFNNSNHDKFPVCALMFKPVPSAGTPKKRQSLGKPSCGSIINTSLFKRKRYLVWTIATPIAFLGYFVPYVHNVAFVKSTLPEGDGKLLITFIAVMSLASRIGCGLLADLPYVNTIVLQQVCYILVYFFVESMT